MKYKKVFTGLIIIAVFIALLVSIINERWNVWTTVLGVAGVVVLCGLFAMLVYIKEALVYFRSKDNWVGKYLYILVVALVPVMFCAMWGAIYVGSFADKIPQPNPKVLVILGGGYQRDEIKPPLEARLKTGIKYIEGHQGVVTVVSGGKSPTCTKAESEAMFEYILNHFKTNGRSVPEVLIENKATNTYENFKYSKQLIKDVKGYEIKDAVFVSNPFHLMRSRILAQRVGLRVYGVPAYEPLHYEAVYYGYEALAVFKSLIFDK